MAAGGGCVEAKNMVSQKAWEKRESRGKLADRAKSLGATHAQFNLGILHLPIVLPIRPSNKSNKKPICFFPSRKVCARCARGFTGGIWGGGLGALPDV